MVSNTKLCPVCGLLNPDSALACNCGHDFETHDLRKPLDNQSKTLLSWCFLYLKMYVEFSSFKGRSRRREFWQFHFFWSIGFCLLGLILAIVGSVLALGLLLASMVPLLAVSVRRLHDTNHEGQWLLIWFIPIIGFLFLFYLVGFKDSDPGENEYGPNPKTAGTVPPDTT